MNKKKLIIYIDTSVFGGCFDDEFEKGSSNFFKNARNRKFYLLISDILATELSLAPVPVKELFTEIIRLEDILRLQATDETIYLQEEYIKAGIITKKYADDAFHVAHASIARADAIVSWNFKHLVNPSKIRAFNAVNLSKGYGMIVILTPEDIVKSLEQK